MRKYLFAALLVAPLLIASLLSAQSPFYNTGPVWRVVYIHLKPGQGDAFWNDVTKNLKPIYDEQKKQNLITDYKFWTNPVADGPNEDDYGLTLELLKKRLAAAKDPKRPVRVVVLGIGGRADAAAMRQVVAITGGQYVSTETVEDLQPALTTAPGG